MKKLTLALATLGLSAAVWAAPTLELETSMGNITVELDAKNAPKSAENFLAYARDGFYNGTVFHRVIPGFMIQGGGFDGKMEQKPTRAPIENEAKNGLKNRRGTLAMARTNDPHSATAQFFINHADNLPLDYPSRDGWGYAVFGKVTQGMDVVDKIANVRTGNFGFHQNVPGTPIVIKNVRIISEK
ncbi:peptidylprolyl isomerase [Azonexus sp.]|uniref:peptidylprolyl isomerase n=1 Tax=Azonexus sp. TaxID=1872668 RepID=UPI0039E6BB11